MSLYNETLILPIGPCLVVATSDIQDVTEFVWILTPDNSILKLTQDEVTKCVILN